MELWDDENFKLPDLPASMKSNKWVGEDEEEDVKESWEDEDEEKKQEEENKQIEIKKSKKKSLTEKIAEKEAKKKEELERKLKEQTDEEISPEERLKMQKESDLKIALETTFGEKVDSEIEGLKLPSTSAEFEEFTESLSKKLSPLSRHGNDFVNFTEGLARNLCASMSSNDIKKIKNALDNLYLEKQKIEKGDKAKKNKGKGKSKLWLMDDNNAVNTQLSAYTIDDLDDFDDFM